MLKVLMVGDIIGRPGRKILKEKLPYYIKKFAVDIVIVNGENSASGNGINKHIADELFCIGVDVLTMGNHTWDKREIFEFIDHEPYLIRPANYPPGTPGHGSVIFTTSSKYKIGVINLSGRAFMTPLDCPFRTADHIVEKIKKETNLIIIDFHAEATSEKIAFGWHMDGKVSAVFGTHTHVQTADERILPLGTAYITDVGMTGPRDSVLGIDKNLVVKKFITQLPVRFEIAPGDIQFNAVIVHISKSTGQTVYIERINEYFSQE